MVSGGAARIATYFVCFAFSAALASATEPGWSVLNVAHRGGVGENAPENTLAAFRDAIGAGADVIELDLRGTRDGQVVVLHDATLDRTTSGRGSVADWTLAELKSLDAGGGERIPVYEEVLELVAGQGVKLLLDVKQSPRLDLARVVRLTQRRRAVLDVIVGVRSLDDLRRFGELDPNLRTLGFVPGVADVPDFVAAGVDAIRLWPEWIRADPGLVGRLHGMGRPVWSTAGDASSEGLEALIDSGVDGILTDRPRRLAALLARRRRP
jgi:glycerophosphoryl diester phosphodiesterase